MHFQPFQLVDRTLVGLHLPLKKTGYGPVSHPQYYFALHPLGCKQRSLFWNFRALVTPNTFPSIVYLSTSRRSRPFCTGCWSLNGQVNWTVQSSVGYMYIHLLSGNQCSCICNFPVFQSLWIDIFHQQGRNCPWNGKSSIGYLCHSG